ncbi:hypothetical protein [Vibrio mediterranei]|uniref:hypothetical protein n=1 Tax=Vibrio mediterranei TaxID=689 RepID=UPI004067C725
MDNALGFVVPEEKSYRSILVILRRAKSLEVLDSMLNRQERLIKSDDSLSRVEKNVYLVEVWRAFSRRQDEILLGSIKRVALMPQRRTESSQSTKQLVGRFSEAEKALQQQLAAL